MRIRDVLGAEGILRLIESVPSPNVKPFKMWLASFGKERMIHQKRIDKMVDFYLKKGYTLE